MGTYNVFLACNNGLASDYRALEYDHEIVHLCVLMTAKLGCSSISVSVAYKDVTISRPADRRLT